MAVGKECRSIFYQNIGLARETFDSFGFSAEGDLLLGVPSGGQENDGNGSG